jgi:excisionase family DNA binding protein
MKSTKRISQEAIKNATSILKDYFPDLTPHKLLTALRKYEAGTEVTQLLTIAETAKILRMSKLTIRRMIKSKNLKAARINGRRLLISQDDLQRLLSAPPKPVPASPAKSKRAAKQRGITAKRPRHSAEAQILPDGGAERRKDILPPDRQERCQPAANDDKKSGWDMGHPDFFAQDNDT